MRRRRIFGGLLCAAMLLGALGGCGAYSGASGEAQAGSAQEDAPLTVYLWETTLFDEFTAYVKEQCPDINIEFIAGNNNVYLYDYLEKHGELPDIITTRRFAAADAKELSPYLMDLGAYDAVSSYYPYILQYYTNTDGEIQWLPVCGIPETMIVNKTLLDEYGIDIPENYDEFVQVCAELENHGVKPYAYELACDWAAHTLIQSAALDKFSGIDGISWRSQAESADGEIPFDEELWTDIFSEVSAFIADTGLDADDLEKDSSDAMDMFANRETAMFRGTPAIMEELKEMTGDELVRIPYFSQTSDESWVYTYPSLNISLNSSLEKDEERLSAAMEVLECFLSQKGQEYIAGGQGMISYNDGIASDLSGMEGVTDEIEKNAVYIRYASNNSFAASLRAVSGLLSGEMDEQQALEAFENGINAEAAEEEIAAEFEKTYRLSVNDNNGRDAASSVLTTVREAAGADLALTACYSYSSSVYEGECTWTELGMICNNNKGTPLYTAVLKGSDVRALVDGYLQDTGSGFRITNKYELPVASGMKLVLTETENGYALKDIQVNGESVQDEAEYTVLLPGQLQTVFDRVITDGAQMETMETSLSVAWQTAIAEGQKPAEPEDYIRIEGAE